MFPTLGLHQRARKPKQGPESSRLSSEPNPKRAAIREDTTNRFVMDKTYTHQQARQR
jgi:hypothetical protein